MRKHSEATKEKMRQSAIARLATRPWTNVAGWNKGIKTGNSPANFKANPGYDAIHKWVRYHLGAPGQCIDCLGEAKEWANISGEYKRDLEDWQPMCVRCHRKFDDVIAKSWATRKAKS
jgi:hypothetical protein